MRLQRIIADWQNTYSRPVRKHNPTGLYFHAVEQVIADEKVAVKVGEIHGR